LLAVLRVLVLLSAAALLTALTGLLVRLLLAWLLLAATLAALLSATLLLSTLILVLVHRTSFHARRYLLSR
jgi:hypothetical protein